MRKFVQLRQDLERVRNLCYMVNRREKLKRSYIKTREQTFYKQVHLLEGPTLSTPIITAILEANHGPSIYDHLYSHEEALTHTYDVESFLSRMKGLELHSAPFINDNKKHQIDFNGALNKNLHFNGSARKPEKLCGSDLSSLSSSETEQPKSKKNLQTKPDKKLVSNIFKVCSKY